jgi:hypothetical protein
MFTRRDRDRQPHYSSFRRGSLYTLQMNQKRGEGRGNLQQLVNGMSAGTGRAEGKPRGRAIQKRKSNKRHTTFNSINIPRRSKWMSVKSKIQREKEQKREMLLKNSTSLWERIRLKILATPSLLNSKLKESAVALGIVLMKNSQALRALVINVFRKDYEERSEWEKQIINVLCAEIDTLKALRQFVSPEAYVYLCQRLRIETYLEGDTIYRSGGTSACSYVVLQGEVEEKTIKSLTNNLLKEVEGWERAKMFASSAATRDSALAQAYNLGDEENELGFSVDGYEKYTSSLAHSTVKTFKHNSSFGSRSRGENLFCRSGTATAIKGFGKTRCVDLLVIDFKFFDKAVPIERKSTIKEYKLSLKQEEGWEQLLQIVLRDCALLNKVHPISLLKFVQMCKFKKVPKGAYFYKKGNTAPCMYIIIEGHARVLEEGANLSASPHPSPPVQVLTNHGEENFQININDIFRGGVVGESFIMNKLSDPRTERFIRKRLRNLKRKGLKFSMEPNTDFGMLKTEPFVAQAVSDCHCITLENCPEIRLNKGDKSLKHQLHVDIIALLLSLATGHRKFWHRRRVKSEVEKSKVVKGFKSSVNEFLDVKQEAKTLPLSSTHISKYLCKQQLNTELDEFNYMKKHFGRGETAGPVAKEGAALGQEKKIEGPTLSPIRRKPGTIFPPHHSSISRGNRPMSANLHNLRHSHWNRQKNSNSAKSLFSSKSKMTPTTSPVKRSRTRPKTAFVVRRRGPVDNGNAIEDRVFINIHRRKDRPSTATNGHAGRRWYPDRRARPSSSVARTRSRRNVF